MFDSQIPFSRHSEQNSRENICDILEESPGALEYRKYTRRFPVCRQAGSTLACII
jgi:hypothetical protein